MKRAALILQVFLFLASPIIPEAQRGRVQIENGTLVTDTGSLLRGAFASFDVGNGLATRDQVRTIKDLGLNCVHLYAEAPGLGKAGYNAARVDELVKWTREESLYVVITMAGWSAKNKADSGFPEAFWAFYAPRYKNETHVVYEICNEPGDVPFDEATMDMERRAYDLIRSKAPKTHVLFLSAWNMYYPGLLGDIKRLGDRVDWKNASIAGHGYSELARTMADSIKTVQDAGYAITVTEFQSIGNRFANTACMRVFEKASVSYLNFLPVDRLVRNPLIFKDRIESGELRWTPDFGAWPRSLARIRYRDPYLSWLAGFYDDGQGFRIEIESATLEYISEGSYFAYYGLDFEEGPRAFYADCSSQGGGGFIDLRLDSLTGPLIGTCAVGDTSEWKIIEPFSCDIAAKVQGVHDLYLVFRIGPNRIPFNVSRMQFIKSRLDR